MADSSVNQVGSRKWQPSWKKLKRITDIWFYCFPVYWFLSVATFHRLIDLFNHYSLSGWGQPDIGRFNRDSSFRWLGFEIPSQTRRQHLDHSQHGNVRQNDERWRRDHVVQDHERLRPKYRRHRLKRRIVEKRRLTGFCHIAGLGVYLRIRMIKTKGMYIIFPFISCLGHRARRFWSESNDGRSC